MSDNVFHDHLDGGCEQCRNQPFNLCPTGDFLLRLQVQKGAASSPSLEEVIKNAEGSSKPSFQGHGLS